MAHPSTCIFSRASFHFCSLFSSDLSANESDRFCLDCSRVANEIDDVYYLDHANGNDDGEIYGLANEIAMSDVDCALQGKELQSTSEDIACGLHLPGSSLAMRVFEECVRNLI